MQYFHRWLFAVSLLMILSLSSAFCQESSPQGSAYRSTRRAAGISPWAAVGAVVLVSTAVALAVRGHKHSSHGHSD